MKSAIATTHLTSSSFRLYTSDTGKDISPVIGIKWQSVRHLRQFFIPDKKTESFSLTMGCSQGKSAAIQNGSTPENKPSDKQNGVQPTAASTNDDNSGNVSEVSLCTPTGYLN